MSNSEYIQNKILNLNSLSAMLAVWRLKDQKIVFTNGCFDLMHLGHIDYLSKAADLGNVLIVGINSDRSTSGLKGPGRPINDQQSRLHIIASLFFVSAVILFDEPTPYELIKFIRPDVLVKGGDYTVENIVGYDIVKGNGGEVITIPFVPGYSTSLLEKKILDNNR